jgi:hypothetical protein
LVAGDDAFTFRVTDGHVASEAMVRVAIRPFDFTGTWTLTDAQVNGAVCADVVFRILHTDARLDIEPRRFDCYGTTTTFDYEPIAILADGRLLAPDAILGTIGDSSIDIDWTRSVPPCGTVSAHLRLSRTLDGLTYTEGSVPCSGVSENASAVVTYDPTAYVLVVPDDLPFGTVDFGTLHTGEVATRSLEIRNAGKSPATAFTVPFVEPPFRLAGGTCGETLEGRSSCSLMLETFAERAAHAYQDVRPEYLDGRTTREVSVSLLARILPRYVAPNMLSVRSDHTCALGDGVVDCWGTNVWGQIDVPDLTDPSTVAAGASHTCASQASGVACWGRNNFGQTTVPPLLNPRAVVAGENHTCALDDNGVTCWGSNLYNQRAVPSLAAPTAISAGADHTCAIDATGVRCWGNWDWGRTTVPTLDGPTAVAAGGEHTCAIAAGGVRCWGRDNMGQSSPPPLSNPTAISAGLDHTCALDDTGVHCWGSVRSIPTLLHPTAVAAGNRQTCAFDDTGVVCW